MEIKKLNDSLEKINKLFSRKKEYEKILDKLKENDNKRVAVTQIMIMLTGENTYPTIEIIDVDLCDFLYKKIVVLVEQKLDEINYQLDDVSIIIKGDDKE